MTPEWNAPGWGDGVPADKPLNFDKMVEAAKEATAVCIEQGLTYGDHITKDAAWIAAHTALRSGEV